MRPAQDLATMAEVAEYRTNYQSGARDVQFNPQNPDMFASAYEQNSIEARRPSHARREHAAPPCRAVPACGRAHAGASVSLRACTRAQIWDTRTSGNRRTRKFISAHQDPVYTIDWHPEGNYLASGSRDRTVKVRGRARSARGSPAV